MEESYEDMLARVERSARSFTRETPRNTTRYKPAAEEFDLSLAGFAPYRPLAWDAPADIRMAPPVAATSAAIPMRAILDTMDSDELFLALWVARFRLQGRPHQKLESFLRAIVNQPRDEVEAIMAVIRRRLNM